MAAKLQDAFSVTPELIPGSGGIFDVVLDGKLVYSKFKQGGFPQEDQLVAELIVEYGSN